jgi:hypothetical protein
MDKDMVSYFNSQLMKSLDAQTQVLLDDARQTSQVGRLMNITAMGQLLAGESMGFNTAARTPTTLSQGDAVGGIKAA